MKEKVRRALSRMKMGQIAIVEWKKGEVLFGRPNIHQIKRIIWMAKDALHASQLIERDPEKRTRADFGYVMMCEAPMGSRLWVMDLESFEFAVKQESRR